jgi:hypothetical protein
VERVYNALPPESRQGRVQLVLPDGHTCGVVHLAATGDQGWARRLWLGWPMMQQVRQRLRGWQFCCAGTHTTSPCTLISFVLGAPCAICPMPVIMAVLRSVSTSGCGDDGAGVALLRCKVRRGCCLNLLQRAHFAVAGLHLQSHCSLHPVHTVSCVTDGPELVLTLQATR